MGAKVITSPPIRLSENIIARGTRLSVPPKHVFYRQEDVVDYVYYLERGLVKVSVLGPNGSEKILCYIMEGCTFGDPGLILDRKNGSLTVAVDNCEVIRFSKEQYFHLLDTCPEFARLCVYSLARKVRAMGKQIVDLSLANRFGRIASGLAYLGKERGKAMGSKDPGAKTPIRIRVTQQELAELTGTNRVTVSNVLNMFEKENIIRKKSREIIILDLEELEARVQI